MKILNDHIKHWIWLSNLLLLVAMSSYAADEEFCTDYVIIAISQYWQSVDDECGISGSRWNSDYKKQYQWCLTAHKWVADNEIEARDRMLAECRAAKKGARKLEVSPVQSVDNNKKEHNAVTDQSLGSKASEQQSSDVLLLNQQLLYAVAEDDVGKAQQLVNKGADLHFVTDDLVLIKKLKMAYHLGEGTVVRDELLSTGAPKSADGSELADGSIVVTRNVVDNKHQSNKPESETLISYAVSKGLVDSGLWLLEQDVYAFDESKKQKLKNDLLGHALINAVTNKKKKRVQSLLEKGAPINYDLDMNFGTPLYFAVTQGSSDIAEVLLAKGANARYSTNAGQNMLNYAINANNTKLLTLLLKYDADPDSNGESVNTQDLPLFQAIKGGNAKAVELLMMKGADPEIYDHDQPYPLLQAVAAQQAEIVEILINFGVNINVVYNSDSTKGCSGGAEGAKNITPLTEAIRVGNKKIMALLEKAGAQTQKELCK